MANECARGVMNIEMSINQYELWFVIAMTKLYRVPVDNFTEAELLVSCLSGVTGVRIARMDPEQGCESVLYNFK